MLNHEGDEKDERREGEASEGREKVKERAVCGTCAVGLRAFAWGK